eukprot:6200882-Pyramimonas_sp.AAC.1
MGMMDAQRKLNDNEASRVRARRLESEANKKARVSHALDRDQSVKLSTNPASRCPVPLRSIRSLRTYP